MALPPGRKRLPWFRCYSDLVDNPKFMALSAAEQGWLWRLWMVAARNSPRGVLPSDPRVVGRYLSSHIGDRPSRVQSILQRYAEAGWLDWDHSLNAYRIHDWQEWQPESDNSTPRVARHRQRKRSRGRHSERHSSPVIATAPSDEDLLKELDLPLDCNNSATVQNVECKNKDASHPVSDETDTRRKPLLEHLQNTWQAIRGTKLSSSATRGDWVCFEQLLKRTFSDPACSLDALKVAWVRFLSDPSPFIKRQGLRYWCSNLSSFLQSKAVPRTKLSKSRALFLLHCQEQGDQLSDEDLEYLRLWKQSS